MYFHVGIVPPWPGFGVRMVTVAVTSTACLLGAVFSWEFIDVDGILPVMEHFNGASWSKNMADWYTWGLLVPLSLTASVSRCSSIE